MINLDVKHVISLIIFNLVIVQLVYQTVMRAHLRHVTLVKMVIMDHHVHNVIKFAEHV